MGEFTNKIFKIFFFELLVAALALLIIWGLGMFAGELTVVPKIVSTLKIIWIIVGLLIPPVVFLKL